MSRNPVVDRAVIPEGHVRLVGCPHPMRNERVDLAVPAGFNLRTMALAAVRDSGAPQELAQHGYAWLDGEPVGFERWSKVFPSPGQTVVLRMVPFGMGGGGEGGKNPMRTVMTIGLMVAAAYTQQYYLANFAAIQAGTGAVALSSQVIGSAISGAVMIGGNMVLNSVLPMSAASADTSLPPAVASESEPSVYSIAGTSNQLDPWGEVPLALGYVRWSPKHGAVPYRKISGKDQYAVNLLDWGYGPLDVSGVQIGDTAIQEFDDYELQTVEGFPETDPQQNLYRKDIFEDSFKVLLQHDEPVVRTTGAEADACSVDLTFPSLCDYSTGERKRRRVDVKVEYRLHDSSDEWTEVAGFSADADSQQMVRKCREIRFPARGQYDVRLTRLTSFSGTDGVYENGSWTCLRTIANESPINVNFCNATSHFQMKATEEQSGPQDRVNAITKTHCLDWSAEAEEWVERLTNNPASLYRHALQSEANPFPRTDALIDLDSLSEWHEFCKQNGFTYNKVSYGAQVRDLLAEIAHAGRATESFLDGRWGVVIERERTHEVPWDFTPENSWSVRVKRDFREVPHALRCAFVNEETWKNDEIIVYASGYSKANATIFETWDCNGVTNAEQLWKLARYHLNTLQQRRETFVWNADFGHLVCSRGSLVSLAHPVVGTGLAQGRVKSVTSNGANSYAITLSDRCVMESGKTYAVTIRNVDEGLRGTFSVTTVPGATMGLTISGTAFVPAKGDMFMFGLEEMETKLLLVTNIRESADLRAEIVGVDYAPQVYELGEMPDWTANVTRSPWINPDTPEEPIIQMLDSDESVLLRAADGTLDPRIQIVYNLRSGQVPVSKVNVKYRQTATETWLSAPTVNAGDPAMVPGVEQGVSYDVAIRTVSQLGSTSAWVTETNHTVVGKSSPPPDLDGLYLQGDRIYWTYASPPPDLDGYRVRVAAGQTRNWLKGTDWPSEEALTHEMQISADDLGSGVTTVMVKPVDTSGNLAASAAVLVLNLGERSPDNLILTEDIAAAGFPGTITGGSVSGSELQADSTGDAYLPDDTALYLPDPRALYLPTTYTEMGYTFSFATALEDVPARLYLTTAVVGESWTVEYRRRASEELYLPDDTALYLPDDGLYLGGPTPWAPMPGGGIEVGYERLDFRITVTAGDVRGVISALKVCLDVPDIEESFSDVVVTAAGTRLPITKKYRVIDYVGAIAIQDDGYGATGVRIGDKNATLGPLLKAVGASQATIDVHKMKGH